MTSIHVEGAAELIKRIDTISGMMRVKSAIATAATMLKGHITEYPGHTSRPNPLLRGNSDKAKRMRAGFFYHLNKGNIQVPYVRGSSSKSEKLGQSWNVRMSNQGFRAVVGTNVSYAQPVQGNAKQTAYHKTTGWPTPDDVVSKHGQQAIKHIQDALIQEVNNG